ATLPGSRYATPATSAGPSSVAARHLVPTESLIFLGTPKNYHAPPRPRRERCPITWGGGRADPGAHDPRGGTLARGVARGRSIRSGTARARRYPQRHRPLPLLADGCDRRRPRPAAASVPRRHRELAARHEHRLDRAQRQRVP